jgi:hypothetical protein
MRTDLPHDVTSKMSLIDPAFTAHITQTPDGKALKWSATLTLEPTGARIQVEYGLRLPPHTNAEAMTALLESIRQTAWQTMELARLGREDLLHYLRTDRHSNRPAKGRPLTPEALDLLRNAAENHARRMAQQQP